MTLVVMVLVGAAVDTTGVDPEGEIVFTTIVPVGLLPSAVTRLVNWLLSS
jgi:hypothetical protein